MVTDPEQLETMITLRTHSMLYVLWTVLLEEMRTLYGKQIIQTKVMLATSIWLHSDSHRPRRRRDKSIRRDSKEGFDHILLAAFRVVLLLQIRHIYLTQGHSDHSSCIGRLQSLIGVVPVHIHTADAYMIRSYVEKAQEMGLTVDCTMRVIE